MTVLIAQEKKVFCLLCGSESSKCCILRQKEKIQANEENIFINVTTHGKHLDSATK